LSADRSLNWLRQQLLSSVEAALNRPWILDIDTTIKTLFGKQSGADVNYNPHQPGRPSHALHTYFVSHLRMVLDIVVSAGQQHSAAQLRLQQTPFFQTQMRVRLAHATLSLSGLFRLDFERS
jgi:hypothetical protein